MAVVASHFSYPAFIAHAPYPAVIGRLAVAVFFVLSGYVIAYVAHEKETTLGQYAVSRLARIYSVAVPAIVLTLAVDFYLIRHGATAGIPLYEYKSVWKYLPLFLGFGGEIAGNHAQVFSNAAFWSLSYEVWYYVAFAIFFYLRGAWRIAFGVAMVPILGLPALVYLPIWVLGILVYRAHQRFSVPTRMASIGVIITGLAFFDILALGYFEDAERSVNALLHNWPVEHLHYSMNFPSFYIAGPLAAANIFFAGYCNLRLLSIPGIRRIVVYLASFTFAIYLSHRPLMDFWAIVMRHDPHSFRSISALAGITLFSCWLFGFMSEKQKGHWRQVFQAMGKIGRTLTAGREPTAERISGR